jgi:hypothetical protein
MDEDAGNCPPRWWIHSLGDSENSALSIELILLAVAVAIVATLLAVRVKRSHGRKIRMASSEGYFDRDVARYAPGTVGTSLVEKSLTNGPKALSPSFVSPKSTGSGKGGPKSGPTRAAPPFVGDDRSSSNRVRAFDPSEAVELRPASDAEPSPPGTTPNPAGESVTPGAAPPAPTPPPAPSPPPLPPLVQPPPPITSPTREQRGS